MSDYRRAFVVAVMVFTAGVASAGQVPLPVSPGDPEKLVLVEARCPTFSWAAVDGAESHELVVYEVGEQGEKAEPVLQQSLPGAAGAWTPSLDRCLLPAGRYAWSVRAVEPGGATEWSTASLFQVAPAPAEVAFEQALEIVRRHLAVEAEGAGLGKPSALQERETGAVGTDGGGENLVASSVEMLVSDGDIAVTSANAALAHAYIQLDTIAGGAPPASSCDEASEYGRLIYRVDFEYFYVCSDDGWRDLNCGTPPC